MESEIGMKQYFDIQSSTGRFLEVLIQIVILLSLISLTMESFPELKGRPIFKTLEIVFVSIFTFELLMRIFFGPKKLKYLVSGYGIIDVLAILPFYLSLGVIDLRVVRILRFLRILRVAKLTKYSKALSRLISSFRSIRGELLVFLFATILVLFVASAGIYFFEHKAQPEIFKSIPHSMWWAVATLTTVGYGDVYPVTAGGKIFTTIILFLGLGVVAIPSGLLAAALSKKDEN